MLGPLPSRSRVVITVHLSCVCRAGRGDPLRDWGTMRPIGPGRPAHRCAPHTPATRCAVPSHVTVAPFAALLPIAVDPGKVTPALSVDADQGLVFATEDGRPIWPGFVSDRFHTLTDLVELPRSSPHWSTRTPRPPSETASAEHDVTKPCPRDQSGNLAIVAAIRRPGYFWWRRWDSNPRTS